MILLILISNSIFSQELNKEYINDWIYKVYSPLKLDSTVTYVLNGHFYNYTDIDKELSKHEIDDLILIFFIDKNKPIEGLYGTPISHIVLLRTGQERRKVIRSELSDIKTRFGKTENTDSSLHKNFHLPVLIIDDKIINQDDFQLEINNLKVSKIKGISFIKKPLSTRLDISV